MEKEHESLDTLHTHTHGHFVQGNDKYYNFRR